MSARNQPDVVLACPRGLDVSEDCVRADLERERLAEGVHLEGVRVEHRGLVGEVGATATEELAGQRRLPGAGRPHRRATAPSARAIAAACGMRDPAPKRTAARLMVPTSAWSIVAASGPAAWTDWSIVVEVRNQVCEDNRA